MPAPASLSSCCAANSPPAPDSPRRRVLMRTTKQHIRIPCDFGAFDPPLRDASSAASRLTRSRFSRTLNGAIALPNWEGCGFATQVAENTRIAASGAERHPHPHQMEGGTAENFARLSSFYPAYMAGSPKVIPPSLARVRNGPTAELMLFVDRSRCCYRLNVKEHLIVADNAQRRPGRNSLIGGGPPDFALHQHMTARRK